MVPAGPAPNPFQSPPPEESPTHVRYVVMGFLLILSFLTYFDRVCIVRAQQEISHDLQLEDWQMGLVLSAFWFAYAVFEIPGGWMGDRYGARVTLTRVVLAWSLFTALSGCASGFIMLLTFRFLFGAGEAGAYPNMAIVQSKWLPTKSRARAGGLLWLAARWGGAFSPMLFAGLMRTLDVMRADGKLSFIPGLEDVASWRIGFWIAGLLGVVWCVAFYPWYRNEPAEKPSVNAAELALIGEGRKGKEVHSMSWEMWKALGCSKSLWAMAFLYVSGSFGWSFFVSWLPKYLLDKHEMTFAASESFWKQPLFYGGISCLVGGLLCDWFVRRTGWKRLGRALFPLTGYLTASIAIFSVQFVSNADHAVVLICMAGAAYDFGQGANWASIVDIGGRYAGTAAGFINMLGNLGNSLQPIIGAWVFNRFGWGPLFVVYSMAFLLAASMWLFIDPTKTFYREEKEAHPLA